MKRVLPIILIILGIVEIAIALMDIKMPIIIAVVLGIIFIGLGVKTLIDAKRNG